MFYTPWLLPLGCHLFSTPSLEAIDSPRSELDSSPTMDDSWALGETGDSGCPEPQSYYRDQDGDGFGADASVEQACQAPPGHTEQGGDCDDSDAEVNPAAEEICGNGRDDNCQEDEGACELSGDYALDESTLLIHAGTGLALNFNQLLDPEDLNDDGHADLLLHLYAYGTAGYLALLPGPLRADSSLNLLDSAVLFDSGELDASNAGGVVSWPAAGGGVSLALGLPYEEHKETGSVGGVALIHDLPDTSQELAPLLDGKILPSSSGSTYLGTALHSGGWGSEGDHRLGILEAYHEQGATYWISEPPDPGVSVRVADVSPASVISDRSIGYFGFFALAQDLNGDGQDDLILADPFLSADYDTVGALYIFEGPLEGTLTIQEADHQILGTQASAGLGFGMSAELDFDEDGLFDLIVSEPFWDRNTMADLGRIYGLSAMEAGEQSVESQAAWELTSNADDGMLGTDIKTRDGSLLLGVPEMRGEGVKGGGMVALEAPSSGAWQLDDWGWDYRLISETENAQAGVRVLQGSLLGTGYSDYILFCQLCSHEDGTLNGLQVFPGTGE